MLDVRVTTTEDSVTGDSEVVGVSIVTVDGVAAGGGAGGGGTGAVDSVNGHTGVVVLAASDVGAQPSDSDLTAIAALSTTTFGRGLLALVDAPALRVAAGLGTAATQASTAFDPAGAAAAAQTAAQAASQPVDADLTAIAALTTTGYGRALLSLANQAALTALVAGATDTAQGIVELATPTEAVAGLDTVRAVTAAGLKAAVDAAVAGLVNSAPGTLDTLGEIAAALAADESTASALATTVAGKLAKASNLSDLANAATARTNLGLGDVATHAAAEFQPADSDLTAIAALTTTAFGRSVLTQADAAAVRALIGAGTSSLALGTTGTTAAAGNDSRLSDARTPTAHAASHGSGGSDPVTIAESQVTNLTTDLAAKVPTTRTVNGHALSADVTLDESDIAPVAPNDQTGTTYTFVLADGRRMVTASNAAAQTYTVPPNSSVAYPLGTVLTVLAKGAGQVTLAPGAGVTLNSAHGLKTSAQWATVSLTKILTDTWAVSGDTTT